MKTTTLSDPGLADWSGQPLGSAHTKDLFVSCRSALCLLWGSKTDTGSLFWGPYNYKDATI